MHYLNAGTDTIAGEFLFQRSAEEETQPFRADARLILGEANLIEQFEDSDRIVSSEKAAFQLTSVREPSKPAANLSV